MRDGVPHSAILHQGSRYADFRRGVIEMASATATGKGAGRSALNMVLFYVFLVIFVFVSVFPLLWVFKMSIVTKTELYATPPTLLPHNLSGAEWAQVLGDSTFQRALINSSIIAGVTTVICLFFGSIAA